MKPSFLFAFLLSLLCSNIASGQTLTPEEAISLSKTTGRPILAMAGRAT